MSDDGRSTARVVSLHGRHALIEDAAGRRLLAHPRGKKLEAVVGDVIDWAVAGDEAVIEAVHPRRNLLHRQDAWRSKSFAANLDQVLVWLAVEPVFSERLLARALIAADAAGIAAEIVLNKIDLPGVDAARARLAPYRELAQILELSLRAEPEAARAQLMPLLQGRVTLVLGPSGAGKSTLINRLVPEAQVQVGELSSALKAGRHTTTATHWYWLDAERGSALIDSPGFQEFGLHQIGATELASHMPDLARHVAGCRFQDCSHRREPDCAVLAAVQAGVVSPQRMLVYHQLRDELERGERY